MANTPAKATAKPAAGTDPAGTDARHPDTTADKTPGTPASIDLDPAGYGFGSISTDGVEEAYAAGPGALDPVRVESVTGPKNSTFAERAAARTKVVTGGDAGPDVTEK